MHAVNWDVFTQFGLAGLILGVFFFMFMFIMRTHSNTIKGIVNRMSTDHKESNNAWRDTFAEHSNRADMRQAETNVVLRDLTKVMTENNVCMANIQRMSATTIESPSEDKFYKAGSQ